MKSDRNREIPVKIERSLWGISAGRCEFEGCNCFLGINPITMETGNYGEKAHIEAVSKGGARYREVMDVEELTLIIYDQVEQSKDFIETITIGGK